MIINYKHTQRDQIPWMFSSWQSISTNVVLPHPPAAVTRSCCCFSSFNSCVFNTFKGTSNPTVKSGGLGTEHDNPRFITMGKFFISFNTSLLICATVSTPRNLVMSASNSVSLSVIAFEKAFPPWEFWPLRNELVGLVHLFDQPICFLWWEIKFFA